MTVGKLQILILEVDNGTVMTVKRLTGEGEKNEHVEKRIYTQTETMLLRIRQLLEGDGNARTGSS